MLVSNIVILRSANVLVRDHGDGAEIRAAMMIDEMLDKGNLAGRDVWKRIQEAVRALLSDEPGENDATHQKGHEMAPDGYL